MKVASAALLASAAALCLFDGLSVSTSNMVRRSLRVRAGIDLGVQTRHLSEVNQDIPHILWFTAKDNILETKTPRPYYENILNTVSQYQKLWEDDGSTTEVRFLSDEDCVKMIGEVLPALVPYFETESSGAFKGDICRVAALHLYGGYYFDIDMETVEAYEPPPGKKFATSRCALKVDPETHVLNPRYEELNEQGLVSQCGFFQSLLVSAPRHPIMKISLNYMLEDYIEDKHTQMLGVNMMHNAYYRLSPEEKEGVHLLDTKRLDTIPPYQFYPDHPRQLGTSRGCNWIVDDPEYNHQQGKIYFWARFASPRGDSPGACRLHSPIPQTLHFSHSANHDSNRDAVKSIYQDHGKHWQFIDGEEHADAIPWTEPHDSHTHTVSQANCEKELEDEKLREAFDITSIEEFVKTPFSYETVDLKNDICALLTLYNQGGFYFGPVVEDVKEPVYPLKLETDFMAIVSGEHKTLSGGFLASTPRHAILEMTLKQIATNLAESKAKGEEVPMSTSHVSDVLASAYYGATVGGDNVELLKIECGEDNKGIVKNALGQSHLFTHNGSHDGCSKLTPQAEVEMLTPV